MCQGCKDLIGPTLTINISEITKLIKMFPGRICPQAGYIITIILTKEGRQKICPFLLENSRLYLLLKSPRPFSPPLGLLTFYQPAQELTFSAMLKIPQVRLQQYVNKEYPHVLAGLRKGRGTRDQIANIHRIIEKATEFQKKHLLLLY